MIVLNPRWLCVDVIGHMLSQEHLETANITGTYTVDDIQQLFPETDALDLLQVHLTKFLKKVWTVKYLNIVYAESFSIGFKKRCKKIYCCHTAVATYLIFLYKQL